MKKAVLCKLMKQSVLFFIESLAGGGAEKVLSDLVSNLDQTKYNMTVISVADGGVYEPIVKKHSHYHSVFANDAYKSRRMEETVVYSQIQANLQLSSPDCLPLDDS